MIEVKNLVKRYGKKLALDDVSFSVNDGEIVGLLGPNGAGKSTTMNIMTGYISSNEGEVIIDNCEILADPIGAKSKIGYLPEQPPLYLDMSVKGYLSFMFDLKKLKVEKESHINEICELVGIDHVYNRIIKNLSKGYKQRVGLAQALLGNPKLIILDEPTVGLDPKQIIEIRNLIKNLSQSHTVILSSHVLSEIQTVCDRVIVINNGKVVADDTTKDLSLGGAQNKQLICRIEGETDSIISILNTIDGVTKVELLDEKEPGAFEYSITLEPETDVRRSLSVTMAENNYPVLEMKYIETNLEDIFLQLTDENSNDVEDNNNQELTNETEIEEQNDEDGGKD